MLDVVTIPMPSFLAGRQTGNKSGGRIGAFLVGLLAYSNPGLFAETLSPPLPGGHWYDLTLWAGLLVVTAYAMGTLHEYHEARIKELRQTYHEQ